MTIFGLPINERERVLEEIKYLISYGGNIDKVNMLQRKLKEIGDNNG
jgi:hypothetical protein